MKRLILPLALAVMSLSACATAGGVPHDNGTETTTYVPIGGANRSQADLEAALRVCHDGAVADDGSSPADAYKRCLSERGWRMAYTTSDDTYPDPRHPGLTCHDIVVFGIVGSSCSNF